MGGFILTYETSRKLAEQSYQHWVTYELFSLDWFVIVIVLAVFYIVWLILLDKSRTSHLLLIGSLSAVGFLISAIVLNYFGVIEYKVAITPFEPPIFIASVTLAPVLIMLTQQYTSSWKGYLMINCLGMGFLAFVISPIYSLIGIYQFHRWNYIYTFLLLYFGALVSRLVYLWIIGVERKHTAV